MKRLLLFIISFYQKRVSPLSQPHCRFYPTCSNYALEAIRRFGAFRGSYLALRRLLKCHPFHAGGVDPVPEKFPRLGILIRKQ